jgi:hypothetical protein
MKLIYRFVLVFALFISLATSSVLASASASTSATSIHNGSLFFPYPGISCGPDSTAYVWIISTAPGNVNGQLAYYVGGGTGWYFPGYNFSAGGTHYVGYPSRILQSYSMTPHNGARITAYGAACT